MFLNSTHNENLNHSLPYPQSKNTYDRYIPNRTLMEKSCAFQAYQVMTPSTPYQKILYRTLFSNRQSTESTLVVSDHQVSERRKEYCETSMTYEGKCSQHITKACEWVGQTLTLASKNCVYNTSMNNMNDMRLSCCVLDDHDEVYAFAWNPKETHLAVAYNQNALIIWDRNVEDYYELREGTGEVRTSQIEWKSPDLIAMGYNLEFSLIDQRSKTIALQHFNFTDAYSGFRCAKDGNRVYLSTNQGYVKTIDIRNQEKALSEQKIASSTLTHFDFVSPSSEAMITSSKDGFIRIFDVKQEKFHLTKKIDTKKPIISFARLNDYWVTGHEHEKNHTAQYWNSKSFEMFGEKSMPGLRYLFTDPSKQRLGVLIDRKDQETVAFFRV